MTYQNTRRGHHQWTFAREKLFIDGLGDHNGAVGVDRTPAQ